MDAIFSFIIELFAQGQTVSNLHFGQSAKMIEVYYDLSGKGDGSFQVKFYCSLDGGNTWGDSLKYGTGEVGDNIKSVDNKNSAVILRITQRRKDAIPIAIGMIIIVLKIVHSIIQ